MFLNHAKKSLEGHELRLEWDGGGDEGWITLMIDDEECNEPEVEELRDLCSDQLGYGS